MGETGREAHDLLDGRRQRPFDEADRMRCGGTRVLLQCFAPPLYGYARVTRRAAGLTVHRHVPHRG